MTKRQSIPRKRLVALGVLQGAVCILNGFANAFSPWVLAESSSPTHMGVTAILVDAMSLQGFTKYFFVRDPVKSGATPLRVGGPYISDSPIKMQEAVWSKDGSVVAIRANSGKSSEYGISGDNEGYFIDAYDFRKHQVISDSEAIEPLLAQRGGEGLHTLSAPGAVGRHVGWWEALAFDTSDARYNHYKDLR